MIKLSHASWQPEHMPLPPLQMALMAPAICEDILHGLALDAFDTLLEDKGNSHKAKRAHMVKKTHH